MDTEWLVISFETDDLVTDRNKYQKIMICLIFLI